jgi:hypothetical protein
VGGEDAEVADEVEARGWDDGAEAGKQVVGLEQDGDGAVAPGLLEGVAELAARVELQAVEGDGRAAEVAAEALEAHAVPGVDGDGGVDVEAGDLADELVRAGEERVDEAEQGPAGALSGEGEAACGGRVAVAPRC